MNDFFDSNSLIPTKWRTGPHIHLQSFLRAWQVSSARTHIQWEPRILTLCCAWRRWSEDITEKWPLTDLAIYWGAFVGWDAIFDLYRIIHQIDRFGKTSMFQSWTKGNLNSLEVPLGLGYFSYDFKECHAWYHPGTPPKKKQFENGCLLKHPFFM